MNWNIRGTGRRDTDTWRRLHNLTLDWTAAWTDVAGFHLDTMPDQPPVTTHLWAWTHHRWLRVRINNNHWWAALLSPHHWGADNLWTADEPIPQPAITPLRHWLPQESQVKQYNGTTGVLGEHNTIQLVPLRPTTAAFIGDTATYPELTPNATS